MTGGKPSHAKPVVMTFSGHDPSGGAGLQADIEALVSMNCHAAPVATAITVQDSRDVSRLIPLEPGLVAAQARAVLADLPVAAFKIGLLGSAAVAEAIHAVLREHPGLPVVLDPITAAGGGAALAGEALVVAMRGLLQRVTLVTPNIPEARILAGSEDLETCANLLRELGCAWVLVTGSHAPDGDVTNRLYGPRGLADTRRWPRLADVYHGSGCTLAAAAAGLLAHGQSVPDAVAIAQRYTWEALRNGKRPGHGQHFPERLYWAPPGRGAG